MVKWLKDAFTEKDNQTADLKRILWATGVVWFMGAETYAVITKAQMFDPQAVSIGLGGLIAAGGAALWMGGKSENGQ